MSVLNPFTKIFKNRQDSPLKSGKGFLGASSVVRRFKNWRSSNGSPDGEIIRDLQILRERSRDLVQNNAVARGANKVLKSNIIGRGFRVRSSIQREIIQEYTGWDEETLKTELDKIERKFETDYNLWANSIEADLRNIFTFNELLNQMFDGVFNSGEIFFSINFIENNETPFRLRIGLIEADQVQTPYGKIDSRTMRDGIETTLDGAPLAYWVNFNQEQYPVEMARIPVYGEQTGRRLIHHLFFAHRPGASRGVPFLASVIPLLKVLGRYQQYTLDNVEVSSMFTAFIEQSDTEGPGADGFGSEVTEEEDLQSEARGDGYDMKLAPAAVLPLRPGEKVTFAKPEQPTSSYQSFIDAKLIETGMALGIPFEILRRFYSASYSASRATRNDFERELSIWREWLKQKVLKIVYSELIYDGVLSGRYNLPGFLESYEVRQAYLSADFVGEAMGSLDELKEVQAAAARVENGFSTRTNEAMKLTGSDYEQNMVIREREEKEREKRGLVPEEQTAPVVEVAQPVVNSQPQASAKRRGRKNGK